MYPNVYESMSRGLGRLQKAIKRSIQEAERHGVYEVCRLFVTQRRQARRQARPNFEAIIETRSENLTERGDLVIIRAMAGVAHPTAMQSARPLRAWVGDVPQGCPIREAYEPCESEGASIVRDYLRGPSERSGLGVLGMQYECRSCGSTSTPWIAWPRTRLR